MKVPENAREQLAEIAALNDQIGGIKCSVPLWAVPLALRALDYEAASGEVTRKMVLAARLAYDTAESYPMRAALHAVAPLLSAAARRKALEEAAGCAEQWDPDIACEIRALAGRPA